MKFQYAMLLVFVGMLSACGGGGGSSSSSSTPAPSSAPSPDPALTAVQNSSIASSTVILVGM